MSDVNATSADLKTKPSAEPPTNVATDDPSVQHIKNLRGVIAWLNKAKAAPQDEVQAILSASQKDETWPKFVAIIKEYPQILEPVLSFAEYQKELVDRGTFVAPKPSRKRRTKEEIEASKTVVEDKTAVKTTQIPPAHQGGVTEAPKAANVTNGGQAAPPATNQEKTTEAQKAANAPNAAQAAPPANYPGGMTGTPRTANAPNGGQVASPANYPGGMTGISRTVNAPNGGGMTPTSYPFGRNL